MRVSGGRIYGQFDCRTVTAFGPAPNYVSIASCSSDEFLLTGGGLCGHSGSGFGSSGDSGFMHANYPQGNSWVVDCYQYHNDGPRDVISEAVAICCKIK